MTIPGDYSGYPGASNVALPGESVEADPYGALAYLESTGQTVAPPLSQLAAAESAEGTTAAPSAVPLALPSALTSTFDVGGIQIPYWVIGVGLGFWYLSSRQK
jgi:hypothetical protein